MLSSVSNTEVPEPMPVWMGGSAPRTVDETGLGEELLSELTVKTLRASGRQSLPQLASRLGLSGTIVNEVLTSLRQRSLVIAETSARSTEPVFALTDAGALFERRARAKSGYVGVAPLSFDQYLSLVHHQAFSRTGVRQERMHEIFSAVQIQNEILDRLGTALNSGRSIFIYGTAGTGKTFVSERLIDAMGGDIWIPHAVAVGNSVMRIFDPSVHRQISRNEPIGEPSLLKANMGDPRLVNCRRPLVVVGGELTLEMLELGFDASTGQYRAPAQILAMNGLLLIDDLGRQAVSHDALLNRWIVPMEERRDFLTLQTGERVEIPFELALVFATNLSPSSLGDDAFLRRIGYKIRFDPVDRKVFTNIWRDVCESLEVRFDELLVSYLFDELYPSSPIAVLPCHPRDLIGAMVDEAKYCGRGKPFSFSRNELERAWQSYVVQEHQLAAGSH